MAAALRKPVLIVPPDADPRPAFRRVLVPLEGTLSSSFAPRSIFELAGAEIDVVALHVHDQDSIPAFTDQPQHEQPAWAREFLERYSPWGVVRATLEHCRRLILLVPVRYLADRDQGDIVASSAREHFGGVS